MTIAYAIPAAGKIKFVSQDGNVAREFAIGEAPGFCDWSPVHDKIAFSDERDDSLYMVNPDGTELMKITDGGRELSWSPDGERIAFDTNTPENNTPFSGRMVEIYTMDVNGSDRLRLVEGFSPDWSPNASSIVFVSMLTPGGFPLIFTIDVDGSNPLQLTEDFTENYSPRWSPSGERIAFISTRGFPKGGDEIYIMDADGSDVTQVTSLAEMNLRPLELE